MIRPWKLNIHIDFSDSKPVYLQIVEAIIEAIKTKRLQQGIALPGSRALSTQLKVNRNTLVKALDLLVAEEWLVSEERRGYFVSKRLPKQYITSNIELGKVSTNLLVPAKTLLTFDDGLPDTKIAPVNELARAYRQILGRKARWQTLGLADPRGNNNLRKSIAQMLSLNRGLNFTDEQIFIARGSQMAAYLIAHCLLKKGDFVAVENPGYKPIWEVMKTAGAEIVPVPVDEQGIKVEVFEKLLKSHKIKAIYLTPHHQFPTTVSLSLPRRLRLIELSNTYGFTIIEDDYDHEFHFGIRPILPIGSLQNIENYVYLGTFSKIVAPALRIGFLATNTSLIDKVAELRKIIDGQGDVIMEQAVYQLVRDGDIKRHIKRATKIYEHKRDFFSELLNQELKDSFEFKVPNGGLAFWLVPQKQSVLQLLQKLKEKNIGILSPEKYSFDEPIQGLRIGYASVSENDLTELIKVLKIITN